MKTYLVLTAAILLCATSAQARAGRGQPAVAPTTCRAEDSSEHEGWKFEYKLKIPVAPPRKSALRDVSICVPKGGLDVQPPYGKRSKPVNTLGEARAEADAEADMIENIQRTGK